MRIEVLLFARLRELAGCNSCEIDVPEGTRVAAALTEVERSVPGLAGRLTGCRPAVDEEFAAPETMLEPGSILAIIPPVSGG